MAWFILGAVAWGYWLYTGRNLGAFDPTESRLTIYAKRGQYVSLPPRTTKLVIRDVSLPVTSSDTNVLEPLADGSFYVRAGMMKYYTITDAKGSWQIQVQ